MAPSVTIRGNDVDDSGGPLTATHTIALSLEASEGELEDNFEAEFPPGARKLFDGNPAFQFDAPGRCRSR